MIDCIKGVEEEKEEENDRSTPKKNTITLEEVLVPMKQIVMHVVIVMDALKDFSLKPLQWALHHLISDHSTITLLGIMPWTPLALSCKTWSDVWTYEFGDLSALKGTTTKTNNKHHKIREVIDLCEQKGVVPSIKVAMGHPLRLVVLEQTTTLHASFVVLDRHQRKNRTFFAKRLPSSVVMMKNDGEVDMLRIQSAIDNCDITPQQSPATFISTQVILSHDLSHLYSKD